MPFKMVAYNDFTGGENDTTPSDAMKDNELIKAQNVIVSNRGGFEQRDGTDKFNATSYGADVNQLIEWVMANGTTYLLALIGYDLCLIDEITGDKTLLKTLEIPFVETRKPHIAYFSYMDIFYFSDGTKYYQLSGTTVTEVVADTDPTCDLGPIKRCKYFMWHPASYRVFAAGDSENPTALYYSEPAKPNFFKATSKLYPTTSEGRITGLRVLLKSLLVSYQNTFRVWDGYDIINAEWKLLPMPLGAISHDSMALTPNSITFYARDGIYGMSPSIMNDDVVMIAGKELYTNYTEGKKEKAIKSIVHRETAQAVFHDNKFYLAYGDDSANSENNKVLMMDWGTKAFHTFTGWQVNCWLARIDGQLLFGSKNYIVKVDKTYLNDLNVETGEAKAINTYIECPDYKLGNMSESFYIKFVNRFFVTALQSDTITDMLDLSIDIYSDYYTRDYTKNYITDLNESLVFGRTWGKIWGFSGLITQYADINHRGFRFRPVFQTSSLNNKLYIYSIGFEFNIVEATGTSISKQLLVTD